jgi:hypothetical protein
VAPPIREESVGSLSDVSVGSIMRAISRDAAYPTAPLHVHTDTDGFPQLSQQQQLALAYASDKILKPTPERSGANTRKASVGGCGLDHNQSGRSEKEMRDGIAASASLMTVSKDQANQPNEGKSEDAAGRQIDPQISSQITPQIIPQMNSQIGSRTDSLVMSSSSSSSTGPIPLPYDVPPEFHEPVPGAESPHTLLASAAQPSKRTRTTSSAGTHAHTHTDGLQPNHSNLSTRLLRPESPADFSAGLSSSNAVNNPASPRPITPSMVPHNMLSLKLCKKVVYMVLVFSIVEREHNNESTRR